MPRASSARNRAPYAPVRARCFLPSVRIVPWLRSQHASRGLHASRRWLLLVVRAPGSGIPVSLARLSGPLPRTEVLFLAVRGLSLPSRADSSVSRVRRTLVLRRTVPPSGTSEPPQTLLGLRRGPFLPWTPQPPAPSSGAPSASRSRSGMRHALESPRGLSSVPRFPLPASIAPPSARPSPSPRASLVSASRRAPHAGPIGPLVPSRVCFDLVATLRVGR